MASATFCPTKSDIPSIAKVQDRFDEWRRNRPKREQIPNELWAEAVELARIHGISKVSSTLRLNYSKLKKQIKNASFPVKHCHDTLLPFIELQTIPGNCGDNCVIDLKRPDGNCMTIQLQNACSASHLIQVIQTFIG